jgi:hypothetical protein
MMVVFGLNSLRSTALNFKYFSCVLKNGLPCWTVIQNWVFRFGLYKLNKALPKRDDWIYILDHTIEYGNKKCLVVLAVSLELFRKQKHKLTHQDMEVAAIEVTNCSTGDDIAVILGNISSESGAPVQIVSDGASNLKKGIKQFQEKLTKDGLIPPVRTYDITHKTALILKYLLQDNDRWTSFAREVGRTKTRVLQTDFIAYAPKKSKDKARWLNLDSHVDWARNILRLLPEQLEKNSVDIEKFNDYFGWVAEYEDEINEWHTWLEIINEAKKEVNENGLSKKTHTRFKKRLKHKPKGKPALKIRKDLVQFFKDESSSLADNDAWLGTSDIIESIFGKYKQFSAKTPLKEVGKSVLTIPVFTSRVTFSDVKIAMETISDKILKKWIKDNIGESLFSERKKVFSPQEEKSA